MLWKTQPNDELEDKGHDYDSRFVLIDYDSRPGLCPLDNVVTKYLRRWSELPISASLSSLIASRSCYRLNLVLPSTKFIQCQTTIRNSLKSSPNADIRYLWQDSNTSTNHQYDQYRNAKHVSNSIQAHHHHSITEEPTSQGLVITSILKYVSRRTTTLWSNLQKTCPKISSISH